MPHRIERRTLLRAPREKVWRALTTEADFERWFSVTIEGRFAPGERVKMTTTHPDFAGIVFFVVVEAVEPQQRFSWRWHPGAEQPQGDEAWDPMTRVEFRLEDTAEGTLLTIEETGFDRIKLERRAKVFAENEQGWAEQMEAFARYVG